jgi:hypothetical protein
MHKYPIQKELLTTSPRSAQVNAVRRKATKRYKQYQPKDITAALYLVATSQASIIQAAKQFNIPTRTLYQRIYNIKKLYATPSSGLRFSTGERATSVLVPNESENGCVKIETDERDVDHGGETASQGPEHIVIKLEPYLLSEVRDPPPRVDSSITNVATTKKCSFDEFKVNELGGFATSQELSEGLKNLMLTSLHISSLRVPSTFMSQ